jgi:hypothetical protein
MMRIASLSVIAVLGAGCFAMRMHTLSPREVTAVASAEAFIARHGYTAAGHPPDQPVQNVEVLDPVASETELVRWRRDTLEPHAFGIAQIDSRAYYVLFHRTHSDPGFRAVLVQDSAAVQVVHSVLVLDKLHWVPVPSNNRWSGP